MQGDGRLAVITGAAGGIGRAVAAALAGREWDLVLLDANEAALAQTTAACAKDGRSIAVAACRVDDEAQVAAAFEAHVAPRGRCDLLVNCAGIGRYQPFLDLTAQDWQDMIGVNLLGTVFVTRAALPFMLRRREGHIVMLGSQRGSEPTTETSAYSASKAGVEILARSLGAEVGPSGVKVSVLCPGGVRTAFRGIPAKEKDERFLTAEDMAQAIVGVVETSPRTWVRELTILPLGV